MGLAKKLEWQRRGSPFRLMTPAAALRDVLRDHGYTVYDIGNDAHLEHDPPEDHTPYSATGWPGTAVYGVGYAIDIMPPRSGAVSEQDGLPLPSLQALGARLLADRKAGVTGIRWLKYMNWEPDRNWGGDCWHESWKPTYARRRSSDRGHIHLSGLTGWENSTVGAGYDPVTRIRSKPQEDDMAYDQEQANRAWATTNRADALLSLTDARYSINGKARVEPNMLARSLGRIEAHLMTLLGRDAVDSDDIAAIVAGVLAGLDAQAIADAIPDTMAQQVVDLLVARLAS